MTSKTYTLEELSKMGYAAAEKYAKLQGISRTTYKFRDPNPPKCSNPDCENPRVPMNWHWINGTPVYRSICLSCHETRTAGKHGLKSIAEVVAKNAGFDSLEEYNDHIARQAGFADAKQYRQFQLELKAEAEGFKDATEYKKHIEKQRAMEAGFDNVSDYRRHLDEQKAKEAGFDNVADYKNSKHAYRYARLDYCENIDGRLGYICTTTMPDGFKSHLDTDHINGNPFDHAPENLQTLCKNCHAYKSILNGDQKTPGRKKLKGTKPKTIDINNSDSLYYIA